MIVCVQQAMTEYKSPIYMVSNYFELIAMCTYNKMNIVMYFMLVAHTRCKATTDINGEV